MKNPHGGKLFYAETPHGMRVLRLVSKIHALEKEMEKEEASADELRERITPHLRKWAELKFDRNELKEDLKILNETRAYEDIVDEARNIERGGE